MKCFLKIALEKVHVWWKNYLIVHLIHLRFWKNHMKGVEKDLVTVSVARGKKYFSSLLSFPLLEKK